MAEVEIIGPAPSTYTRAACMDINLLPILAYLKNFPESGGAIAAAKSLSAYYDRLAARPSFQKTAPPPRPQAKAS